MKFPIENYLRQPEDVSTSYAICFKLKMKQLLPKSLEINTLTAACIHMYTRFLSVALNRAAY